MLFYIGKYIVDKISISRSFNVGFLYLFKYFSPCFHTCAMNGIVNNTRFIHNHCEGKAFGANPRHHVLGFNKMGPCEVVLVSDLPHYLCIMVCGGEKHHIRELLFPC